MAYFERAGRGYRPRQLATGPWSDQVVGGGPIAALLAHALEQQLPDKDCRLSRLTVDLLRSAPNDELEVDVQPVRIGQRVQIMQAWVACGGAQYARATGVFCRAAVDCPAHLPEASLIQPASPATLPTSRRDGAPSYASSMEVKSITYPDGGDLGVVWIRFPHDLLPDVPLSPVSRTALTGDAVSGFAFMTRAGVTAVNNDVTLYSPSTDRRVAVCPS